MSLAWWTRWCDGVLKMNSIGRGRKPIRSVCTQNWKIRLIENDVKIIHGGMPSSGSGTQNSNSNQGFHFCRTAVDRLKYGRVVVRLVAGPHQPDAVRCAVVGVPDHVDDQQREDPGVPAVRVQPQRA